VGRDQARGHGPIRLRSWSCRRAQTSSRDVAGFGEHSRVANLTDFLVKTSWPHGQVALAPKEGIGQTSG
jgi:hypothetical protein